MAALVGVAHRDHQLAVLELTSVVADRFVSALHDLEAPRFAVLLISTTMQRPHPPSVCPSLHASSLEPNRDSAVACPDKPHRSQMASRRYCSVNSVSQGFERLQELQDRDC
uniref:(northern house mosquito) hypothetical protein n=1 Tax=Culex pipiens TaxID=7175 RepID=A0A8D8IDP3_CULPI